MRRSSSTGRRRRARYAEAGHSAAWQSARRQASLAATGASIDVLTVSERLEAQGDLAKVGGAARLTQLILAVPSAMHVEAYAAIVREWALRRKLMQSAGEIAKLAADSATDIEAVTSGSSAALLRAIQTPQELVVRTALEVGGATWQALNSGRSIFMPTCP